MQTDVNFDADNYPLVEDDYSLQVIQIAESSDKELFVYVYQPSGNAKNLIASSLFLSTAENGLSYTNYYLTLVNSQGVFYKYRVNNFFVSNDVVRHYEITSIYRPFDETIDKSLEDDSENIINEVDFKVAKHWIFTTTNNDIDIVCQDIETITITDKYVGFVRYGDGDWWHLWGESACDRHFVAFSTDKEIDKLMEADIYYQKRGALYTIDMDYIPFKKYWTYGNISDGYSYLTYTQKGNYDNGHYNYSWDRIQSVDDFKSSVNISNTYSCGIFDVTNESKITAEGVKYLEEQEWVLSFLETSYVVKKTGMYEKYNSVQVSNVSILRLKFETDGVIYNLGVIDNKQSGSLTPINTFKTTLDLNDMFKLILMILLLILLLVILSPFISPLLNVLFELLKVIIKIAWWIICLPFKLIKDLIKDRKKD